MSLRLLLVGLILLAACATSRIDEDLAVREVSLGSTVRLGPLAVTPTAIAEDSRCPEGVQCIQAGTVRIEARVVDRRGTRSMTLSLGVPVQLAEGWVGLVQTCPNPVHPQHIDRKGYRLRLMLSLRHVPPTIGTSRCARS